MDRLLTFGRTFLVFGVTALPACSLVTDFDTCASDTDCAGELRCVEARCIEDNGVSRLLEPTFCHQVYPDELQSSVGTDDVYLIGTLLPITGRLSTRGPGRERAVYMAVDEINAAGGIGTKKLAVLSCDSGTDAAQATEAARFMAEEGQVAATIGAASSGVTIAAFSDAARAAGMLMISPASTSVLITDLQDDGLLWRTAPSDAGQGIAIAELITSLNANRIAVVNRDDAYGNSLRDVMQNVICERIDCADRDIYTTRSYADNTQATDLGAAVGVFEQLDPDVIVAISFSDDAIEFLRLVADSAVLRNKPIILTDGAKDVGLIEAIDDAGLIANLVGTNPASPDNPNSRTFTINYRGKYNEEPTSFTPHSYDAAYLLAYALSTIPEGEEVTGTKIAAGLRRMSQGENVDVGPAAFASASRRLASSPDTMIDFNGASGPLNFDPETGEALGDIEAWRFDGPADEIESLGVVYESASGTFIPPDLTRDTDAGVLDSGMDGGVADTGTSSTADAGASD